ncbi:MAG TPA: phosphatidate cytidylyltransferase [Acetobacteraceae bacterium]|nr:phosphatidate cytidylyltransferase [Acetobacteraceae bacterium]
MPAPTERPQGRWADLTRRAVSALVMAPVALACVWLGGAAFAALVAAGLVGLVYEWLRLCRRSPSATFHASGILYVLLAGGALLWLRDDPLAGRANVLFLLLVVWAGDIGAYLIGRWIGGTRLAPGISPGKTWSGAVGGLVAASVVGLLAAGLLSDGAAGRAIPLAAVLGIVAQAGDLLESFVKRRLEVKDSGHLIPGHGGLFDRLDGVLAAAPVAALLALTLGRGVVLWQ